MVEDEATYPDFVKVGIKMVKGEVISTEIVETKSGQKWCVLGVRVGTSLGFIWSRSAYKIGEEVNLIIGTDYEHRFVVRIAS